MAPDLEPRKRALMIMYNRYLQAERAWRVAQREARAWFPDPWSRSVASIGAPGSRIRSLYNRRHKALDQFTTALRELHAAQREQAHTVTILALGRP